MKNAHLRFGWLTYVKTTEKAVTNIRLRLDRFIGEVLPDPPRQAKAHLISVIGGDTQIAAVSAAISMGERFMVEGPGRAADSRLPGTQPAVLQRVAATCRSQEASPSSHRSFRGVCRQWHASGNGSNPLSGLGSVVRVVVTGADSRHPRNSRLGRVVSAATRKTQSGRSDAGAWM